MCHLDFIRFQFVVYSFCLTLVIVSLRKKSFRKHLHAFIHPLTFKKKTANFSSSHSFFPVTSNRLLLFILRHHFEFYLNVCPFESLKFFPIKCIHFHYLHSDRLKIKTCICIHWRFRLIFMFIVCILFIGIYLNLMLVL